MVKVALEHSFGGAFRSRYVVVVALFYCFIGDNLHVEMVHSAECN